jgi:YD repeat-containing protein
MTSSGRCFSRVFPLLVLAAALWSPGASAQCVESGGKTFCRSPEPKPWGYGACDSHGSNAQSGQAWCAIRGGSGPSCEGATPDTEGNIVDRSNQFANWWSGSSCALSEDTDWGASTSSFNCASGSDGYSAGFLTQTYRRLTFTCAVHNEAFYLRKERQLECPIGYTANGATCVRPLESCCTTDSVGNPITPGTGVKVETETDYRHALGLEFTRHYHSFQFYEPYATQPGVHTETRLGSVWRSGFDRRVIPTTTSAQPLAISLPGGEVQYFSPAGVELYNYRGASGTLTTAAGVGYFYKGPERTEFFGTDGRLRTISRASGEVFTLTYSDGTGGPNGGFILDAAGQPTAKLLPANSLIRVSDAHGNTLALGYDVLQRMVRMTAPGGSQYRYGYDEVGNLTSVTFPDGRVRTYNYNEPANMVGGASLRHALTSIVDENNDVFASFKYDTSGRAVSTEHAGGAGRHELTYNANGTTDVNDPRGTTRTFGFPTVDGIARFSGSSLAGGAGFGAGTKERAYDTVGNVASVTDHNDIKTCYAYLADRNLETVRVEGVPAATACAGLLTSGASLPAGSRKVSTEWHARWRLPLAVAEPLRRTTFSYNGDASCAPASAAIDEGGANPVPLPVLCSRIVQATSDADGSQGFAGSAAGTPRASSFTYNANGKVLTVDGPRTDVSDVTTYTYGTDGNVASAANAASHATSITAYNAHGQPLTIIDPNGLTTTLAYDERQRLTSRSVGSEVTSYDYDSVGQLTRVTLPDGSYLEYTYDAAHRLTGIADSLGNRIAYSLDAMGNRTQEQVRDPSNALAQTRTRVFNSLNRLFQELGATGQTTEYAYDNQGNVTSVKDPLNKVTANQYDALNRLKQVTDPGLGVTQYGYNGLDALVSVSDPRSLVTGYTVDGLGNLNQQVSPDTGTTTNTYDAAGNLLTQTDAKGQVTTYAYDALNRVTLITFHDGSKQQYAYDAGANGIGRLASITERDPANQQTNKTSYAYDSHGRVATLSTEHAGITYNVGYAYSAGRLAVLSYPSGRTVSYGFDSAGRVSQAYTTKDGQTHAVFLGVSYHPFGGVKAYTLGNGQAYVRGIDLDGRIGSYTLGAQSFGINYDAASRIEMISDLAIAANQNTYGYDSLDRLTSAFISPNTPYAYTYDAVGNRTSKGSETYTYSTTSNRLATVGIRNFSFDLNGSTTADGNNTYGYDVRGRMVQATSTLGATDYKVNALGQRIRKANSLGDTVYHYDSGGRLIAETSATGTLKREYFYLGDVPVAVLAQ